MLKICRRTNSKGTLSASPLPFAVRRSPRRRRSFGSARREVHSLDKHQLTSSLWKYSEIIINETGGTQFTSNLMKFPYFFSRFSRLALRRCLFNSLLQLFSFFQFRPHHFQFQHHLRIFDSGYGMMLLMMRA